MLRKNISSGGKSEASVGYSRAVKVGNFVFVSGTAALDQDEKVVHIGDPYLQAKYILQKIAVALEQADASLSDVVRTRMYVTDMSQWPEVGRAHGEFFKDIRPASLLVEVKSLGMPEMLVEIEADAVICEK
jgi:enamine deaminase RidA (YjgF/YER057c/UK114 family)